jgi:hypothetical protein
MATPADILVQLQLLNAQAASGLATRGPLSDAIHSDPRLGVAPGRLVYDPVTGQTVIVLGATVVYLPQSMIDEVTNAG